MCWENFNKHLGLGAFKVCVGKTLKHFIMEIFRHLEATSNPINSLIEWLFNRVDNFIPISEMHIVAFCAAKKKYRLLNILNVLRNSKGLQ